MSTRQCIPRHQKLRGCWGRDTVLLDLHCAVSSHTLPQTVPRCHMWSYASLEKRSILLWIFNITQKLQTTVQIPTFLLWASQILHANSLWGYKMFIPMGLNTRSERNLCFASAVIHVSNLCRCKEDGTTRLWRRIRIMSFNYNNNYHHYNHHESSSMGHQGEMMPDKSSLQSDCLSGKVSIEVKVEMCLLCPSHVTVLFMKMPLRWLWALWLSVRCQEGSPYRARGWDVPWGRWVGSREDCPEALGGDRRTLSWLQHACSSQAVMQWHYFR